ncbi:MAG: glycosyltransferase family 4 protein [bacterium]
MKILLVTLDYPPQFGGVGNYYQDLVETIGSGTVDVWQPLAGHWLSWFGKFWQKSRHYDLIWVGQLLPVGTVAWLCWLAGRSSYVISFHGLDIVLGNRNPWKRWLFRHIVAGAKAVSFNSKATETLFKEYYPANKESVVVYPVPHTRPAHDLDKQKAKELLGLVGKKVLLTVGRLVRRKGQRQVVELLPDVLKQVPNLQYILVGQGKEEKGIRMITKDLGLENTVQLLLKTNDQELSILYTAADVFILLNQNDPNDPEGFGIVYLEAARFSLPSIAGVTGGVGEAVVSGETGLIVNPDDNQAVMEAIVKLLTNEEYAKQLGNKGRERAEQMFSIETEAEKMKQLFIRSI